MPTTRERGGVATTTAQPVPKMPVTTTGRTRTRTPATVAKSTRSKKEPVQQDDELADELERVLKISQAKVPVKRITTKAPSGIATKPATNEAGLPGKSARTVKKAASTVDLDNGNKADGAGKIVKPVPAIQAPKATATTAGSSKAVQPTIPRRKAQVSTQSEAGPSKQPAIPPKSTSSSRPDIQRKPDAIASSSRPQPVQRDPPAYVTDPSLTPVERARTANVALNSSQAALGLAIRAGYRIGRTVKIGEEDWTDERVEEVIWDMESALNVLAGMDERGELGNKGFMIDKGLGLLVQRCLGMAHYSKAMELVVSSQSRTLRLYPAKEVPPRSVQEGSSKEIPTPWRSATSLPPSTIDVSQLDEGVRFLLFQSQLSAWICLIALRSRYTTRLSESLPSPDIPSSSTLTSVHPLSLVVTLPRSATASLIKYSLQLISNIPTSSSDYAHATRLTAYFTSLTLASDSSRDEIATQPPGQIWENLHKKLSDGLQAEVNVQELAAVLSGVVGWVEGLVDVRKEDRAVWFGGKSWTALMDMWIGMGRKLNDMDMIHQALSRMTASTSIGNTVMSFSDHDGGPSTPRTSTPPTQLLARPVPSRSGSSRRTVQKVDDAESSITHLCGELSALAVLLDKYLDAPDDDISAAAVQSALTSFDILALSDAVLGLSDSQTAQEAFDKVSRNVERIRRRCTGTLGIKTDRGVSNGVQNAAHRWLVGSVDLVDDCVHGSQMDLTQVYSPLKSLVSGAITTLSELFNLSTISTSTSSSAAAAYLDRIHLLVLLSRPLIPLIEIIDFIRFLVHSANSYTCTLYNKAKFADAMVYAKIAAERSSEMMEYLKERFAGEDNEEEQKEIYSNKRYQIVRDGMPKRWETVAQCALRLGDHKTYFESLAKSLSWTPLPLLLQLQTLSSELPYSQIWLSHPDLQNTLHKLAQPLINFPISETSYTDLIISCPLQLQGEEGDLVKALVLEKWMEALEKGVVVQQVKEGILRAGEWILGIYKAEQVPVRRMRVINRLLGVMLQTDAKSERSVQLLDEMVTLTNLKDLSRDQKLAASIPEYKATALLLRALFAHRNSEDPTLAVSTAVAEAMTELRQIILPPMRSKMDSTESIAKAADPPKTGRIKQPLGRATTTLAPSRTTASSKSRAVSEKPSKRGPVKEVRKVSDIVSGCSSTPPVEFTDLPRLISILTSLISLLGLLALPLQKIEALKLARALMRNRDDFYAEYTTLSSRLGTEYARLGKWGRATAVFTQARKISSGEEEKIECGLRWGAVLAQMGRVDAAKKEYEAAYALYTGLQPGKHTSWTGRTMERAGKYERAALARATLANIAAVEGKSAVAFTHLGAAYRLYTRFVEAAAALGPAITPIDNDEVSAKSKVEEDDPFSIPSAGRTATNSGTGKGADQPAKDAVSRNHIAVDVLQNKVLSGLQWHATETLLSSMFDLGAAYAMRGTARDAEYFLEQTGKVANIVRAPLVLARSETRLGQLEGRMKKYESSTGRLEIANGLYINVEGPDAVHGRVIQGDLLEKRQAAEEALMAFEKGGKDIEGLEAGFGKNEALMPTPEKSAIKKTSISSPGRDQLLPSTMAHVLRQQIWLGRQGGVDDVEKGDLARQIQALEHTSVDQAEEHFLTGRLALLDVLKMFKTDLFMSSLTDSTIAMPMSSLTRHTQNRHSTRRTVNALLARSSVAFQSAIELLERDGKVEDVRQAGLSLALLHAFQTSLGEGGVELATAAADLLASMSCVTIGREMITAIESKFIDGPLDDLTWPSITPGISPPISDDQSEAVIGLRSTWNSISARLQSSSISSPLDLSPLPPNWAVISISVAEDHSTIFLSRHQRDHPPLVLCLPLDRQGKREGEDNPLPFAYALEEMKDITDSSDAQARNAKYIESREGKAEWWAMRHELDKRMGELLSGMEENWLGAFKSILKPQTTVTPGKIAKLRTKLEKIFTEALVGIGTDMRKLRSVKLDDAVLACFATLDGTTSEDELEDLVYFMLDLYGFHGIPVAISELDIDQIGVDIKQALTEIDVRYPSDPSPSQQPEHLLLILDKNVQSFPWESIPVLRGRPISRIPSLPFLLDHLRLSRLISPEKDGKLSVNARKVFYILNPSGDLTRTQTHFEPWIEQMQVRAGWKGIIGRAPTDLEMVAALKENDLVLFFGHGGAEQYVRSRHVQHLPRCATTFLWGCSSGLLKDQGDLDRTGTAWNYMMAGCPSLIANLWDVTDRDIDRLSSEVHKKLGLDASHLGPSTKGVKAAILPLSEMSTSQALNASRDECRLKYLTGAAPVVYGLPVWMF